VCGGGGGGGGWQLSLSGNHNIYQL
jgi:hypothetical protein